MSTAEGGGNIVTDGLVLLLDAANTKSYVSGSTIWNDLSKNSNNGTLINGPTFNSGNSGNIVFDGTNDYMVTNNLNLSTTNATTLEFWCKLNTYPEVVSSAKVFTEFSTNYNSITTGFIIAYADDSSPSFGGTFPISLSLRGNAGFNISYWSKTLVNDLNWHHWCCIFDKSQSTAETFLYIDGVFRTGTNPTSSNSTNNFGNLPLYFGGRAASFNSNVNLSNFKIYNRVLSATEISQNFNATRSRFGI
jgi:hypothetical protein